MHPGASLTVLKQVNEVVLISNSPPKCRCDPPYCIEIPTRSESTAPHCAPGDRRAYYSLKLQPRTSGTAAPTVTSPDPILAGC